MKNRKDKIATHTDVYFTNNIDRKSKIMSLYNTGKSFICNVYMRLKINTRSLVKNTLSHVKKYFNSKF